MSLAAQIVLALVLVLAGAAGGIRWHAGQDAIAEQARRDAEAQAARQERAAGDRGAIRHAESLIALQSQLGDARAHIARLSGRPCLDPGTVRVLDDINLPAGRAGAAVDASAAAAAAADPVSDADAARAIAECRAAYVSVAGQLTWFLDREDRRHPLPP